MADGMELLAQKVEDLTLVTARLDSTTHELTWILSDENVGLVKQVGRLASVVSSLEKSRDDHERRMQAQETRHNTEDLNAVEAKKPLIAIGWSILEKLTWIVVIGAVGWLGSIVLAIKR